MVNFWKDIQSAVTFYFLVLRKCGSLWSHNKI